MDIFTMVDFICTSKSLYVKMVIYLSKSQFYFCITKSNDQIYFFNIKQYNSQRNERFNFLVLKGNQVWIYDIFGEYKLLSIKGLLILFRRVYLRKN